MRSQALKGMALVALAAPFMAFAQAKGTTAITKQGAISGEIKIDFGQEDANGTKYDLYKINGVNVADYIIFKGDIKRVYSGEKPHYHNYMVGINVPVKNQLKEIGSMRGQTLINSSGQFLMKDPSLQESLTFPRLEGNSLVQAPFEGRIQGKKVKSWSDVVSGVFKDVKAGNFSKLTRTVGGKTISMDVKGQDPLTFQNLTIAGGPYRDLQPASVNGDFTYAYTNGDSGVWTTQQGVTIAYQTKEGAPVADKITGSLLYKEESGSATVNGKAISYIGYYDANLLFNEDSVLSASEESVFAGEAQTELSEEDLFLGLGNTGKVPSITGRIYFTGSEDSQTAVFALDANNLTPVQMANFMKVYMLIIGPLNDD